GMFGDVFEDTLQREHGLTMGHWPSSFGISTVGGWIACRGAGQLSTRYGKIEDMVFGMDVVLADGSLVTLGGYSR
ncbi:FAD-binding oxidoreductase, partial [Escherichia coli]|uniref:FAD-binding oxidoreductase n=2 Tax=Pseudomonadota TaxID=1224 RepID=UPI0015F6E465